ncbi:MAG: hypothetical protein KGM98_10400 [Bacteroidota bacterium]|nr:hypothetical protein [Bacteroidota bacterium]
MRESNHICEFFYQQALATPGAIQQNASKYPYCAYTSMLALYHLKKTQDPSLQTAVKKKALLFPNTDWLLLLLHQVPKDLQLANYKPEEVSHETEPVITEPVSVKPPKFVQPEPTTEPEEITSPEPETSHPSFSPENTQPSEEINSLGFSPLKSEDMEQQDLREQVPESENPDTSPVQSAQEPAPESSELTFEPLHTVDYFASIGVKIDEETLKDDKLASQVKSFTEWLKTMKKIHPDKLGPQDAALEKIVQASADESNINTEILTEAMAEVLVKQQKKDKAIEMFQKLSLINPAKSAYFAAKIESIKSS